MPIYRTDPTADFVQITNVLTNTPMEYKAKDIILHLLSKPPSWQVIPSAICKVLDLSKYIVKKSLSWLRKHGYAIYTHSHTGYGQWHIFDTPQPKNATAPANPPKFVMPTLAIPPTLEINKETVILKKQQHEPAPIDQQKAVVVFFEEIKQPVDIIIIPDAASPESLIESDDDALIYPDKLDTAQKKAAKAKIKKAPVELQQDVLFELAYRMTLQKIRSVPAFLNTLITAANNGTFTRTQPAGAPITNTRPKDDTPERMAAQRAADAKPKDHNLAKALFASLRGVPR